MVIFYPFVFYYIKPTYDKYSTVIKSLPHNIDQNMMPSHYPGIFVELISKILYSTSNTLPNPTCFDSMSIYEEYTTVKCIINNFRNQVACPDCAYIIAFIYIDRLLTNNEDIILCNQNVLGIVSTGLVLAVKYIDDKCMKNSAYALVTGLTLEQLNMMEFEFLKRIQCSLYVNSDLYLQYVTQIEATYVNLINEEISGTLKASIKENHQAINNSHPDCNP